MNAPRRKRPAPTRASGRPVDGRGPDNRPIDIWRPVAPLPDPAPIVPATDPTALLRSLGDPPLHSISVVAGHYLAAVLARAAGLATGLAASADLLGGPPAD